MSWVPPDLSDSCSVHTTSTVCTPATFLFLQLVARLFGQSRDGQKYTSPRPVCQPLPPTVPSFTTPFGFNGFFKPSINFQTTFPEPPSFDHSTTVFSPKPTFPTTSFNSFPTHETGFTQTTVHDQGFAQEFPQNFDSFLPTPTNHSFQDFFLIPIDKTFENQKQSAIKATNDHVNNFEKIFGHHYNDFQGFDTQAKSVIVEPTSRYKRQGDSNEFDFIVIGGGSAGCVVANRLSDIKKWKVLLLEAGIEEPEAADVPAFAPMLQRSNIDWNYRTQPEKHSCRSRRMQGCGWARGKVMGGSSTINYMIYIRGNRRDYDEWEELGNHGWSYNHVLPYFKKFENNQDVEGHDSRYHGTKGELNVERFPYYDDNVGVLANAWKEYGLQVSDFNAEQQLGVMVLQTTSINGERHSANRAFIRPIRYKRPNLTVRTQAHVTRIIIDPHTKTAVGVEYLQNNKIFTVYARKEVILSAGALNSPKILMLSGVGPKHVLEPLNIKVLKDLAVGYNLQDHVTTDSLLIMLNKTSTSVDDNTREVEINNYYCAKKKQGPLASFGALGCNVFLQTKYEQSHDLPDIQYHFDGQSVQDYLAAPDTASEDGVAPLAYYDGIAARPTLMKPKSRGYLTLNTTDPLFGQPLIYPRYYTESPDLETMIAGIREVQKLENTQAFRKAGAIYSRYPLPACSEYKFDSDAYWACCLQEYTSTIFHPVGTCKMGPHWDNSAVVDPTLKVYGINRLRVIDASIMPTIVRGNTNAPTMMIGEKASDMIKEEWLSSY